MHEYLIIILTVVCYLILHLKFVYLKCTKLRLHISILFSEQSALITQLGQHICSEAQLVSAGDIQ